jgi:hypothetical protein
VPALHEVRSLETETLRSQLRLAPAAAVLVPERNCKRVRSSEISCFRTGQLLRLCGSDSTLRPKPASGSQALSGVRAVAACLGGSCLVRHRHGYTLLALVPTLHPTFLCSNAQPSCVSPHHKSSHCHILWPHIDCTLRCGCHCAKSMYHTCVECNFRSVSCTPWPSLFWLHHPKPPLTGGQCSAPHAPFSLDTPAASTVELEGGHCVKSHLRAVLKTHHHHPIARVWPIAGLQ